MSSNRPGIMKLSWAVLVDVGTVCKVFMCNRHMQIVTTKDSNSDVKCHLVHFDSLADTVNVEKEEAVVKQCVRISVMFTAELFSAHITPRRSSLHANLYRQIQCVLVIGRRDICHLRLLRQHNCHHAHLHAISLSTTFLMLQCTLQTGHKLCI